MPRKRRQLDRDAGVVRDATLVVIASEDKYAVENYFQRFRTKKVQFRVLPTLDCNADPQSVLARIDEFRKTEDVEDQDVFWICIDSDHWVDGNHLPNLVQVLRESRHKGYHVAINNPCIELWFLLHFVDYSEPPGTDRVRCSNAISQLEAANAGVTGSKNVRAAIFDVIFGWPVRRQLDFHFVLPHRKALPKSTRWKSVPKPH